ncbi:hypothetical protein GOBAR_AA17841 [Gossypium barbadense]|uniref:Uncharacterized protein n=1 Tax=Gossypium barbadense TaxID=3634 RepID=A0A2P5XHL8_GOSBA|nr:hypothetical protein GOBAR_AA17841 [Gossypium barbadense]
MERRGWEKSIRGVGAMSNRSEIEVFSDAATEFQDGESGWSTDIVSQADKALASAISFKDGEDFDILQSPRNSVDGSQNENPVPRSMPILPVGTPEHHDVGLSYSKDSEDKNGSASEVVSIEMETLKGISEESRKVNAGVSVAACSVGQATDANENEGSKFNENLSSALVLPSKHAGKLSETESISETRLDETSDISSKTSISGNCEHETDGKGNPGISFEENLMDAGLKSENAEDLISETALADKIVELEENSDNLALNTVIDDLLSKAESTNDKNVSTGTFELQTDVAQGTDSSIDVDSNEVNEKKEKEKESGYVLCSPDDIPVVDDAEIKLEGFKDHTRVNLPQSETLASKEIIVDKEDKVKDHVSQEKSNTFVSNPMDEEIAIEDSYKLSGNNEAIIEEVFVIGNADVIQIDKGSDALVDADTTENEKDWVVQSLRKQQLVNVADELNKGSNALSPLDADTSENEKDQEVLSLKEQQPVYVADDLQKMGFQGSMLNDAPDVKPMVIDADVKAGKLNNVVGDENYVKNMRTSCESMDSSSLLHANPAFHLLEVEDSDDIGTRKTEKSDINEVESGDGLEEGYVSTKMDSTSESTSTHYQSAIVTEEVNETEGLQSNSVSNSEDYKKEPEISKGNKVHGECAAEDLMASAIDNSERNEFERTSVNQLKKELVHSGPVNDSHNRESRVAASQTSAAILQGEAKNGSSKPQLDTTVGDFSIESNSRTDSLEGHWGSVSVLSTQSDNQAAMDTETLPSTGSQALSEAEKANTKKSKLASKEQHFNKSDEFEPPSFMTLVEGGGSDQKAAAVSEAPTGGNPRAGWFPSLTHATNESQGRKKNEEIIQKVANWNANQHGPLKNLANNDGGKVSSMVGPETPMAEATNVEAEKEWKSPARYPSDRKREKRKAKGRPLWDYKLFGTYVTHVLDEFGDIIFYKEKLEKDLTGIGFLHLNPNPSNIA